MDDGLTKESVSNGVGFDMVFSGESIYKAALELAGYIGSSASSTCLADGPCLSLVVSAASLRPSMCPKDNSRGP